MGHACVDAILPRLLITEKEVFAMLRVEVLAVQAAEIHRSRLKRRARHDGEAGRYSPAVADQGMAGNSAGIKHRKASRGSLQGDGCSSTVSFMKSPHLAQTAPLLRSSPSASTDLRSIEGGWRCLAFCCLLARSMAALEYSSYEGCMYRWQSTVWVLITR